MVLESLPDLLKIVNICYDSDLRMDEFIPDNPSEESEIMEWVNDILKELVNRKITIKTHELIDIYNLLFDDMKNKNWEEIGTNEQIYDMIIDIINDEVIGKIELLKRANIDDINNATLKDYDYRE